MATMTLRLDGKLEHEMEVEQKHLQLTRSELVRQAIQEFLKRQEHQRFIEKLAREMSHRNPVADLAMAEEALFIGNEALLLAEGGETSYRKARKKSSKRS